MAETTTTKQAAVWKPPRLRVLGTSGVTRTGTRDGDTSTWETSGAPASCPEAPLYRMPFSGEPVTDRPDC